MNLGKIPAFIAILWTATLLTPPAPITRTLLTLLSPRVRLKQAADRTSANRASKTDGAI
jgi:hypothetical protein